MDRQAIDHLYELYGARSLNRKLCFSLKHNYMYVPVPKNGTTSVNHIFQTLEMQELARKWIDFHPVPENSPFIKPYQMTRDQLAEALSFKACFKFTFVRDPFRRAVSAWRDKICGNRQEKAQILKALGEDPAALDTPVSFSDFLAAINTIPDQNRDDHWASQNWLTLADHIQYDFICRMESFDGGIMEIASALNLPLMDYYPNEILKNASSETKPYQQEYSENDVTLVREIYADDFTAFDYSVDL